MTRSAWKLGSSLMLVAPLLLGAVATSTNAAVTISNGTTANMTCIGGVCSPTAADAVLNAKDLKTMLASGSVSVESGSTAQDIVVTAPLKWTSGITLTLDAYRSLTIEGAVTVKGSGGLTILTNDGGTAGVYSIEGNGHVTFAHVSSPLTINGHAYKLANSLPSLVANIHPDPSGYFALANSYDASNDGTYVDDVIGQLVGTLDGLGNTISNVKVVGTGVATFINEVDGTVEHFNLRQISLQGNNTSGVAGLAIAAHKATIYEDTVTGSATGGSGGGLVGGTNGGVVQNCFASVAVTASAQEALVGGLLGLANGTTVSNTYATGSVTATGFRSIVGGLIGLNVATVSTSYSTGAVSVSDPLHSDAGGLIGQNQSPVTASYSTGEVTSPSHAVGGFVGYDPTSGGITKAYWDTSTSEITDASQGAGRPANDPGITGLTTVQLQAGLPAGFAPAIWAENPDINGGLPYLKDLPPQ